MCENETSYTLLIFVLILGFLINPILPSDFNELKIDIGGWNARYAFIVKIRFLPSNS